MNKNYGFLVLFFSIFSSLFSDTVHKDLQDYQTFMESADIRACQTTLNALFYSHLLHCDFIIESSSQLNLMYNKSFSILGDKRPSHAVLKDPQKIYQLLRDLERSIGMVYELDNALNFNYTLYLKKLASFTKTRPSLNAEVKRTADEFYKQVLSRNTSREARAFSVRKLLFSLEGEIATRLSALNKTGR